MLTFADAFELEVFFSFIEAKTENIRADLKGLNCFPKASLATGAPSQCPEIPHDASQDERKLIFSSVSHGRGVVRECPPGIF